MTSVMKTFLAYPWAFLYGLYFYILFQLVFLVRFGHIMTNVSVADLGLYVVGVGSVLFCQYLTRKLEGHEFGMAIAFIIALPFAFVLSFFGGLFGILGVIVAGLIPFAITLSVGYWVLTPSVK